VANVFNTHLPASIHVPTAVVFFIFTAIFTQLITVPYTVVTPRYFQVLAHPYGMLLAEFTTSVFWLAGFAAVATRMGDSKICQIGACASARGCVAVGVLEL
jgi:cellobiose-specific phosphotransferase system component IIC